GIFAQKFCAICAKLRRVCAKFAGNLRKILVAQCADHEHVQFAEIK
ncbi:6133_t:CDS:1, partial [Rhizophagus irregularis]